MVGTKKAERASGWLQQTDPEQVKWLHNNSKGVK
jgi:hypothetical protein